MGLPFHFRDFNLLLKVTVDSDTLVTRGAAVQLRLKPIDVMPIDVMTKGNADFLNSDIKRGTNEPQDQII